MISSHFQQDLLKILLGITNNLTTIIEDRIYKNIYRSNSRRVSFSKNYKIAIITDSFWVSYHFLRILCQEAEDSKNKMNVLAEIFPTYVSEFRRQYNSKILSEEYFLSRNSEITTEDDFNSKGGMAFNEIEDIGLNPGGLLYHYSQRICFQITGERTDPLFFIIMGDLAKFFGMNRQLILAIFKQYQSLDEEDQTNTNSAYWFDMASEKLNLHEFQGAIIDFTEAIRQKPDLADAYYGRGFAKSRLGDYQGAIVDFTKVIGLISDYAGVYCNRANAKRLLGDYRGAITDYAMAIGMKSDDVEAYYNRGGAKANLEDLQGAIADFTKVISLKPEHAEAYRSRGLAKAKLKDLQGALNDYTMAIDFKPDDAEAYCSRGLVKSLLGDVQGAITDYTMTIGLKSDDAEVHYNRGLSYLCLDQKNKALADLMRARELGLSVPQEALDMCK